MDYAKTKGAIYFGFNVGKKDYVTAHQEENWGVQPSKILYYLGINKQNSTSDSFSKHLINPSDLSFNSVKATFAAIEESIKNKRVFDKKIGIAKRGNEDVFIAIDGNFYIVNATGLIQLNSKNDVVSIDGKRSVLASTLNSVVKRKQIKGMTPLSGNIPFEIYTE